MKNFIYAATDAAQGFARASAEISRILTRVLDSKESITEKEGIKCIRNILRENAEWAEEIFNGILKDGIS